MRESWPVLNWKLTNLPLFRSQLIPESHRATVSNWFRVPMNLMTCAALLAVNNATVAADKRLIFAVCTVALAVGTFVAKSVQSQLSKATRRID